MVNTNLFVAAIKNPKRETASLRLLMELTNDASIVLIGNEFLIMELEKYAQVFESKRGKEILRKLIDKTEVMDVDEKYLRLSEIFISSTGFFIILSDRVLFRHCSHPAPFPQTDPAHAGCAKPGQVRRTYRELF